MAVLCLFIEQEVNSNRREFIGKEAGTTVV